jgi:VWFA-related protein
MKAGISGRGRYAVDRSSSVVYRRCPVFWRGAAALAIALASAAALGAAGPRAPAGPTGPGQPAARPAGAPQQAPTFRSSVEVVAIDVSVVDPFGRPIGDLRPSDFQVQVDRRPRTIVSAQFLKYQLQSRTDPKSGAAGAVAAAVAARGVPPEATGRNVLIVFDEDSVEPGEVRVAAKAAQAFLDRLAPADRVGLTTIPRLTGRVSLTTRHADVRRDLDTVTAGVHTVPHITEYNIGLAEAFAIERMDSDVIKQVIARECVGEAPACPTRIQMEARQVSIQAHLRGQRTIDAMRQLAEGLSQVPGPKTLVLVSGGMPMPDASSVSSSFSKLEAALAAAQVSVYTLYMERSMYGQVKVKPSPTAQADELLERDGVENVTLAAGGTLLPVVGQIETYFDRVVTELSGSYLLGIEVAPTDRDGRPHLVDVKVHRSGLAVRSRQQDVIQPAAGAAPAEMTAIPGAANAPRPALPWARRAVGEMTPEVEALVERAAGHIAQYEAQFPNLAADERYQQKLYRYQRTTVTNVMPPRGGQPQAVTQQEGAWAPAGEHDTRGDYVLVKASGATASRPFRDAFEVDGKRMREPDGRLEKAFLNAPAQATKRAAEIAAETSRYSLNFLDQNVNLPTLAVEFLKVPIRTRFLFWKAGEVLVGGVRTWEIAYSERVLPTIVQTDSGDVPVDGSFWIDPATGHVVRSTLGLTLEGVAIEITVTWRPDEKAGGAWVPSEMREVYEGADRKLECLATYLNVRKLDVAKRP